MSTIRRGALAPARWHLLACGLLLAASCSIAAAADGGIVDVHKLPQLEGAVEDTTRPDPFRAEYCVPTAVAVTTQNVRALLTAEGWVPYVLPLEEKSGILKFKKGRQGLSVHFTQAVGRPDQSIVYYSSDRIYSDVPFPNGAGDVLFDGTRPYLSAIAPGALEATSAFYTEQMAAIGWRKLTSETASRWTNSLDESVPNGVRAFYDHPEGDTTQFYKQKPVMLALTRREDGRTQVEIRIAPFALPAELQAGDDMAGLPRPNPAKSAAGKGGASSNKREMTAAVLADLPAVLAFYKRELAARGWREDGPAPLAAGDDVAIKVASAEETGVLRLGRKYDFTMVSLAVQLTDAGLAARARAKKEADEKFFRDAGALASQIIAADEVRRKEQAAGLSDAPLKALADPTTPLPLPETAEGVKFDGSEGHLEFTSSSSVKAIGAFYRATLKPAGWAEQPSVINQPNMAVLQFSKGGKSVSMTVMQMGPKVNVSASGAALKMAAAAPAAKAEEQTRPAAEPLKPDLEAELPLPLQRSSKSMSTMKLPGNEAPFRRELEASIPAPLADVLTFYRGELSRRGWTEKTADASVAADRARIEFVSPQGPALLKLGRARGETTVSLAQKNAEAATKADIMPKPGQARLMLGNVGPQEAVVTINKQTIKVAAGAGSPQTPKGPMLDLPPGTYQVALKVAGQPARTETLTIAAGDAWGLMVGPGGDALPLQMY